MRSRWAPLALGLLGPLFVAVIGNFDMARRIGDGDYWVPQIGAAARSRLGAAWRRHPRYLALRHQCPSVAEQAFWDPSRVIPGTINEFPYFTMLFADFHPHLIALPFTSAALVVALGILLSRRWPDSVTQAPVESDEHFRRQDGAGECNSSRCRAA